MDFLNTILSAAAIAGSLVGILLWLFKNLILAWVNASIKSENDEKLAKLKTEMQEKGDEKLRQIFQ